MTERFGGWIATYTGLQFWPLDPHVDDVWIMDIAAGLSKLCRFGGQCIQFYSVAEHCVHVASCAPDALKLSALMHDAAEAYLVDVPRPIKQALNDYQAIENRLMRVIAYRFGFEWPVEEVNILDNRILIDECYQNMAPSILWSGMFDAENSLGVTLQFWEPSEAQARFIQTFYDYGGKS